MVEFESTYGKNYLSRYIVLNLLLGIHYSLLLVSICSIVAAMKIWYHKDLDEMGTTWAVEECKEVVVHMF